MLSIAFAASGSLLARFYGNPLVANVSAGLSVGIFIAAASVIHQALLKRAMRFGGPSANEVIGRSVNTAVSILLALRGWGYWALVAGIVAQQLSITIGAWWLCRWVPSLPRRTGQGQAQRSDSRRRWRIRAILPRLLRAEHRQPAYRLAIQCRAAWVLQESVRLIFTAWRSTDCTPSQCRPGKLEQVESGPYSLQAIPGQFAGESSLSLEWQRAQISHWSAKTSCALYSEHNGQNQAESFSCSDRGLA